MAGSIRTSQRGVTLVELLVAMVIVALATTVVLVNAPAGRDGTKREAERFAARLVAASHRAVTAGHIIGLEVLPDRYQFVHRRDGEWQAINDRVLGERVFEGAISLEVTLSDTVDLSQNDRIISRRTTSRNFGRGDRDNRDEARSAPQIQFDPYGQDTPHVAVLTGNGEAWSVSFTDDGEVRLVQVQ